MKIEVSQEQRQLLKDKGYDGLYNRKAVGLQAYNGPLDTAIFSTHSLDLLGIEPEGSYTQETINEFINKVPKYE